MQFLRLFGGTSAVLSALLLAACGGTSSSSAPPPPGGGGGGTPVSPPKVVTVNAGQTTSGINIAVVPPVASPPPNIEVLGVADVGSGGSAANTGGLIHRGTTMRVLTFGHGMIGTFTVTISGPPDIKVSNITNIKATDGTPGIAFDAAVSGSAALGARTVRMVSAQNDVTTFTGGLEVVP